MSTLSRRAFLAASGVGVTTVVTGLGTTLLSTTDVAGAAPEPTGDRLVLVFLAGGADGLTIAPPYGYPSYRQYRPTLAVPEPGADHGALELTTASSDGQAIFPTGIEGTVGLHPSFQPLHDTLWKQGRLAVLPMIGLPGLSRSHFSAQRLFHHGGAANQRDGGWLGRAVEAKEVAARYTSMHDRWADAVLAGTSARVGVIDYLDRFGLNDFDDNDLALASLTELYRGQGPVVREGRRTIAGIRDVAGLDPRQRPGYPRGRTGRAFSEIATLFEAFPGIRVASIQIRGWDHHGNMGAGNDPNGRMARMLADFAGAVRAFADDTDGLQDTTIMVITEFGRTINENGSGGTDHGRAGTFLAMGGGVRGGVFGNDYPDELTLDGQERGDSPILTDFRQVAWELLNHRFGVDPRAAFPDYRQGSNGRLGLARGR